MNPEHLYFLLFVAPVACKIIVILGCCMLHQERPKRRRRR